jgi:hypothetical protein
VLERSDPLFEHKGSDSLLPSSGRVPIDADPGLTFCQANANLTALESGDDAARFVRTDYEQTALQNLKHILLIRSGDGS